jgi:hypothetical protein
MRAAQFTLVPAAYLSMPFWQVTYGARHQPEGAFLHHFCLGLMVVVFALSLVSWNSHRIVAILGFIICLLWLFATLLLGPALA